MLNQINTILDWCDTHVAMVNLLRQNFDDFIKTEVPKIETFYANRESVFQTSSKIRKAIDWCLFSLGMLGPSNVLQLISFQIARLKRMASHVVALKNQNQAQMQYIADQLGNVACARLTHLQHSR